jgi:hypothetical protein
VSEPDLTGEELLAQYEGGRRDFHDLCLDGIRLANVTLERVWFARSSLVKADFSGAALPHVNFGYADLTEARFREASLSAGRLSAATLVRTDFHGARLADASLTLARCIGADMRDAELGNVAFRSTDLTGSDLAGAFVDGATFQDTILRAARFAGATLADTRFFDVDVGPLCDATFLNHRGPSWIDPRTVVESYKHPRLKSFMIDCGVPEIFAEYMIECARAVGDDLLQELMQTTFISYGGPDEAFARRLYDALRAHGVVTFFFPETARVGERIDDEVFNALQRHDRMILVCSRDSLDRPGVLNEVQETLDREARDGGATYLIPVMLDDYLLTDWKEVQPELAERVGRRVAADFSGARGDSARFEGALSRLLAALRKKRPR